MELMERRRILLNTPHINIVTGLQFVTDMVAPIESLVISFLPIQDLHGYDSPWPAGGGKNLFNASADTGSFQYVVSGCPGTGSGSSYNVRIRDANYTALGFDVGNGATITPTETKTYYYQITVVSGYSVSNLVFKPMICLSTASNPDYAHFAPYSNICHISGRTGLDVTITGKNLFDGVFEDGIINGLSGQDSYNASYIRSKDYIPVEENTSYTVSSPDFSGNWLWYEYRADKTYNLTTNKTGTRFTTYAGTRFVRFRPYSTGLTTSTKAQVERGSSATAYEPYHSTTYPISWQTEAGTVYGGTIDVTTGMLTVTHALYTFDGSSDEVWTHYTVTQGEMFRTRIPERKPGELTTISGTICDSYKVSGQSDRVDGTVSGSSTLIDFINNNYSTITEWTANLAEHPVNIVCELNAPSTYQLTPQQVLAFKGINNLSMSGQVKFWTHRD